MNLLPRLKSEGNLNLTGLDTTYNRSDFGGPFVTKNITLLECGADGTYERFMSGYDIPNYHKRRNAGELLPHTPFKQHEISIGTHKGTLDYHANTGMVVNSDKWVDLPTNVANDHHWFLTQEVLESYANVLDPDYDVQRAAGQIASSGFDALTFLIELREIRSLFSSTIKQLLNARLPKGASQLSDAWLTWRYGWRTLIYDLEELNELIVKLSEKQFSRVSKYSQSEHSFQNVKTGAFSSRMTSLISAEYTITDTIVSSTRGSVVADIEIPALQFNAITTAWEVTKLSFVVDWLINVGQALDAIDFLVSQTNYTASVGRRVEVTRHVKTNLVPAYTGAVASVSGGSESLMTGSYSSRQPATIPVVPQFRLRLDLAKSFDLLALFYQRYK